MYSLKGYKKEILKGMFCQIPMATLISIHGPELVRMGGTGLCLGGLHSWSFIQKHQVEGGGNVTIYPIILRENMEEGKSSLSIVFR